MRVRITATPKETELDGVRLDTLEPGMIREVSASIGAWLIAQGYAKSEMRSAPREGQRQSVVNLPPDVAHERRRNPR